jgi:hypothetical protein
MASVMSFASARETQQTAPNTEQVLEVMRSQLHLANNVTDSVHVFTFESPAESWEENWAKFGTPILSKINVLPNVPAN